MLSISKGCIERRNNSSLSICQDPAACVFNGAAQLTTVDPSHEYCQFRIGTNITQAIGLKAFVTGGARARAAASELCTVATIIAVFLSALL